MLRKKPARYRSIASKYSFSTRLIRFTRSQFGENHTLSKIVYKDKL
jgi:hypothetical protein